MERDAQEQFVIPAQGVLHFAGELAITGNFGGDIDELAGAKWNGFWQSEPVRGIVASTLRRKTYHRFSAELCGNQSEGSNFDAWIEGFGVDFIGSLDEDSLEIRARHLLLVEFGTIENELCWKAGGFGELGQYVAFFFGSGVSGVDDFFA